MFLQTGNVSHNEARNPIVAEDGESSFMLAIVSLFATYH